MGNIIINANGHYIFNPTEIYIDTRGGTGPKADIVFHTGSEFEGVRIEYLSEELARQALYRLMLRIEGAGAACHILETAGQVFKKEEE